MLQRIYVDNYRCLVNFELKLDRMILLLGENGAGKTNLFSALRQLQRFLLGQINVGTAFSSNSLTRWQTNGAQTFELELQLGADLYLYALTVSHDATGRQPRVGHESLKMNNLFLFLVQEGAARRQENDGTLGAEFPFDPAQSVIGSFLPATDNQSLTRFKQEIEKIVVCNLHPTNMLSRSPKEVRFPTRTMNDFVSWYRYLSQEYQGSIFNLNRELQQVLPGFHSFSLKEVGENIREMRVYFQSGEGDVSRRSYAFRELSDGQRVLVVLYTLLYGLEDRGAYLFLDEPENFVALREIQPWLTALYDRVGGGVNQAVLISHHPEIINYLGATEGRWFTRPFNGPARVNDQPPAGSGSSLPLSEIVARGWER